MKKSINIKYDHLQSQSGIATIGVTQFYFLRIEVSGNFLILYEDRNGFDHLGRIKAIFDLNEYSIEVE